MIKYRRSDKFKIIGYTDSDYTGCQDTMKSIYISLLVECAISWKSTKQYLIISSTMAAKLITCYEAFNHRIWLRNFITGLRVIDSIEKSLKLFCYNNLAVLYSNNNRSSTKSKYIDIKLLTIKESV